MISNLHRDALEAFNRASHSDALREMQLVRYEDPIRRTPRQVVRSLGRDDLFVSIATATLLVIVIPLGLLVLSVLGH